MEEIDLVVDRLKEMVERVRSLSPEYEEYMAGGRERQ
jgi:hypothetical protein